MAAVPATESPVRCAYMLQGISCSKGQCGEVMLKHTQADTKADVFQCVGCCKTVAGRSVEGCGPLDVEKQADDLYNHALSVLQQQVWVIRFIHSCTAALVLLFCC